MEQADIAPELRQLVRERAFERCEYCGIPEHAGFSTLDVDHIIAEQHGGPTLSENRALACLPCNRCKGTNVASFDSQTGELSPLFNSRNQIWTDHFSFDADGRIFGRSSIGRTTLQLRAFNDERRLRERQLLMAANRWNT